MVAAVEPGGGGQRGGDRVAMVGGEEERGWPQWAVGRRRGGHGG